MGDGNHAGDRGLVAPDGCLCDAAMPGLIYYKQGDGRVDIHDWGMEFTAAGLLMQSELLLISRDKSALDHYLPRLERCANFIETRRDGNNDLFLAGPAGNLLAPSYAGWKKPDGTFGMSYLTGLSVTYIAALDRLIELEKMAGQTDKAAVYRGRRGAARRGLDRLATDEGYFIRSLDPDGTPHGIYGARQHGYFETSPNHDAIAFRVVDDEQAGKIYRRIASIPELRPHDFILPNYPSYDDMYEEPKGLWEFGRWVNGGHWSTCEARMIMAYYRLGKYDDITRSMRQLLKFASDFRMDNPLTEQGNAVYQPKQPINICYDTFGPAAAQVRGLFEYRYSAKGLTLYPHIPATVTALEQHFPIRFGEKQLYLSVAGAGPIREVRVNSKRWTDFEKESIFLAYDEMPKVAHIRIALGDAKVPRAARERKAFDLPKADTLAGDLAPFAEKDEQLRAFLRYAVRARLGSAYEAAHARLVVENIAAARERQGLLADGELQPLSGEGRQAAADKSYVDTIQRLCEGFEKSIVACKDSTEPAKQRLWKAWEKATRE
ncbi:MAG: hypothetical protein RBU21_09775 [FCB group bacterium]|jgi:hypothetical protein|nr:hypothetical protein [FCB group bacterium]